MFSLDVCVAEARSSAAAGDDVITILENILVAVGPGANAFRFVFTLHAAFAVPVRTLKDITSWDRLSDSGLMTTGEVVEQVRPWLEAAGAAK